MADWETISRLCREALSRETKDRSAFLEDACAGVPEVRHRVDELIGPGSDTFDWLVAALERRSKHAIPTPEERPIQGVLFDSPFSILNPRALSDVLALMKFREFQPAERLVAQGDPAEFLLLIVSGSAFARLRNTPDDRPPLGEFGPGDIVGEISLVTDEPRTADVIARTHLRSLQLSASDFHTLADRHPDLRTLLTDVVADRLGQAAYDGLTGKDIHGYRITQCIGRGGMGVVYEATSVASGQKVALKMMNHRLIYQSSALRRFRREAAILKTLEHPALARLYESFSAYKTEFLAMEFCQGQSLTQVIAARGPLKEHAVRPVLGQLAMALNYVHGRGVVHRDLKPSNIVLTPAGRLKLLDFGIVTVEEDSELWNTQKTSSQPRLLGTPRYMAPEQFSGRVSDRRVDYYGVASVVFEMLTGRPVVSATDVFDIIREHEHFALPGRNSIGEGVSEDMYEVLLHGLEPDPDKRSLDFEKLATWAAPIDVNS